MGVNKCLGYPLDRGSSHGDRGHTNILKELVDIASNVAKDGNFSACMELAVVWLRRAQGHVRASDGHGSSTHGSIFAAAAIILVKAR